MSRSTNQFEDTPRGLSAARGTGAPDRKRERGAQIEPSCGRREIDGSPPPWGSLQSAGSEPSTENARGVLKSSPQAVAGRSMVHYPQGGSLQPVVVKNKPLSNLAMPQRMFVLCPSTGALVVPQGVPGGVPWIPRGPWFPRVPQVPPASPGSSCFAIQGIANQSKSRQGKAK